ncbi:FlxA-like family protein [Pseudobutyrivibrio sp.]|uniref:FlxA-like family protein n=1 Tax=Pseudobutyrivibrio sp. TaxID=2014367 RepID=UPI001B7A6815|nr:FlxA-like family protein [Pseudobutyrivibrio sp.]MBP3261889.1 FlxA-like family protein [Pseudobutyrivibrio sp.]
MGSVYMNINMNSISELHKSRTTFQINQNQQMDSYSKSLQEQINNAHEQLQSLGEDKEMSIDEKMKKRQEIQKQITDLQNQLRQHQIEQKKENRQSKGSSMEDMLGGKQTAKSSKAAKGISTTSMKALISADSAINQVEAGGAVKANLKGEAGILETEIKLDSARGKDVEKKQEQLADIESRNRDIESDQLEVLNRADKELDKAAENNNYEIADKSTNSNKEPHEATVDNSIPEGVEINPDNPVGNNIDELL